MITELKVIKLFGRFNYDIITKTGGVTIITGPNGYGKSTILKIIYALSVGDFLYFCALDFSSITYKFDNGKQFSISKNAESIDIDGVHIPLTNRLFNDVEYRKAMPWMRRNSNNTWVDMRTDQEITEQELKLYSLLAFDSNFRVSKDEMKYIELLKDKIAKIKTYCGEVRLISEQRLIKREVKRRNDEEQVIDVISELPKRLKLEITKVSEEYSDVANNLDSSYPKRLFAAKEGLGNQAEYNVFLDEANKKFEKLNQYNLVDNMLLIDEQDYDDKYSTALKIYFEDFSKKYKVFEGLISKLDLFTEIINTRLSFKKIHISRQDGFEVIDEDFPDRDLDLRQLSSGEKQEIVLFYELIFETESNLLLLIDEPEISLHITWQKKFMNDLLRISQNSNIRVIVATHSPQIVSDHWDIQIDLGELYEIK